MSAYSVRRSRWCSIGLLIRLGARRLRCQHRFLTSGYGKSTVLSNVRKSIAVVTRMRPKKFRPVDAQPGEFVNVVTDEATPAGILSCLRGCTKLLAPDEGDEVFRDMGLVQSYNQGARFQTSMSNARSRLTSLYDRPQEFVRVLKDQQITIETNAKLNILVRTHSTTFQRDFFALGRLFWQLHCVCAWQAHAQ